MPTLDPRVDAYIAKAAEFARPILLELRARMHTACPDVVEAIKWGMPSFEYKGPMAGMAAFQKHCTFGFLNHELILGARPEASEAMGSFGRITGLRDLPNKREFARFVKVAVQLNDDGVKATRKKTVKPEVAVHPEFAAALRANAAAKKTLDGFPAGQRREYVQWIAEAKQDATRTRRIAQAIEWLAEGKRRNWKYEC